mgnify:CR=1 FL=1
MRIVIHASYIADNYQHARYPMAIAGHHQDGMRHAKSRLYPLLRHDTSELENMLNKLKLRGSHSGKDAGEMLVDGLKCDILNSVQNLY